FTRTKHGANRLAEYLSKRDIPAMAIHGNKSQTARTKALESFKNGTIRVLAATDIAARGIDIDGIRHVINFELPDVPEAYVHRIGRTARAGAEGTAVSFCGRDAQPYLRSIERLIRSSITVERQPKLAAPSQFPARAEPSSSQSRVVSKGPRPARGKARPPRQNRSKSNGSSQQGNGNGKSKAAKPKGRFGEGIGKVAKPKSRTARRRSSRAAVSPAI
ncbi:MAG TPA: C-terminal helicase domain-containing protein, partial [Thermoguttaceae bacterium]|nr:C-terminal helicase domain-containing protein [Thermoguttaceae bacterium]